MFHIVDAVSSFFYLKIFFAMTVIILLCDLIFLVVLVLLCAHKKTTELFFLCDLFCVSPESFVCSRVRQKALFVSCLIYGLTGSFSQKLQKLIYNTSYLNMKEANSLFVFSLIEASFLFFRNEKWNFL